MEKDRTICNVFQAIKYKIRIIKHFKMWVLTVIDEPETISPTLLTSKH